MSDLTVARTILAQLGSNMFCRMTGAKSFVGDHNSLQFSIPMSEGINKIRIELTPMDTYNMIFYRERKTNVKEIKRYDGVYADQLQDLFTVATNLYTRL